jgi:hypothetical protein
MNRGVGGQLVVDREGDIVATPGAQRRAEERAIHAPGLGLPIGHNAGLPGLQREIEDLAAIGVRLGIEQRRDGQRIGEVEVADVALWLKKVAAPPTGMATQPPRMTPPPMSSLRRVNVRLRDDMNAP